MYIPQKIFRFVIMKIKALIVFLFAALIVQQRAVAQKEESPKLAAQKDFLFHKQFTGGMRIVTTGLDFYLQYGIIKNIYTTHLFTLEYEWHVDYRDKKTTAQPYYTPVSYTHLTLPTKRIV